MKKRNKAIASALGACMCISAMPAYAQAETDNGPKIQDVAELYKELNESKGRTAEGSITFNADGINAVLGFDIETDSEHTLLKNLSYKVRLTEEGLSLNGDIENLLIAGNEGLFLNIGAVLDTAYQYIGNRAADQLIKMAGIDTDWIRLPDLEELGIPYEELIKLVEPYSEEFTDTYNCFDYEEIENGYRLTADYDSMMEFTKQAAAVVLDNKEELVRNGIDLLKKTDIEAIADKLIEPVKEGIADVDPGFDVSEYENEIYGTCNEITQAINSLDSEEILQMMEEEGINTENIIKSLEEMEGELEASLDNGTQKVDEDFQIFKNMSVSMDFTRQGDEYKVYCIEDMSMDNSTAAVKTELTMKPDDSISVELPQDYMDYTDAIREISASAYAVYFVAEVVDF